MKYEIVFSEGAVRDLKNVPHKDQLRIIDKIGQLANAPFPKGCIKLKTTMENL